MTDPTPTADAAPVACPQCGAGVATSAEYCGDCGYLYANPAPQAATISDALIAGRYRLKELISERGGVSRYRGEDIGLGDSVVPVIVIRQPTAVPSLAADPANEDSVPSFELDLLPAVESPTIELLPHGNPVAWPGVAWEEGVLLRAAHLSLPRVLDSFTEDDVAYLVEEVPAGERLWDAWDRDNVTHRERYAWLLQVAEAIVRLHVSGAILEGLRPEMVTVTPAGSAILADLSELLPLPLPGDVPLRGGFSTAPELLLDPHGTDERADLYAFGAMLYALLLGRELSDLDFTLTGMPRHYLERVPDANPFVARVVAKTFTREADDRFPTHDGSQVDPTGFRELIVALEACRRHADRVKLEVAAWSTTGIVRSGNEDAVQTFHASSGQLDQSDEAVLVLLADGMGGMESGEVAASLALATLREELLSGPPFGPPTKRMDDLAASEEEPPAEEDPAALPSTPLPVVADTESPDRSAEAHAERVTMAMVAANQRVFEAARANPAQRGMGCTAEVVLVDGATAIVGHVGDSRVYRCRHGRLTQVTRDHTLVGRLVEMGQITEAEAETHPRRSELQQAVGGRADVFPDVYVIPLQPGDWLLVCSDGLSNQATRETMQAVIREARNAERAARRLVNLALADGAIDNVTVAVIRAA